MTPRLGGPPPSCRPPSHPTACEGIYRASHYSTWTIDASPKEQFVSHNAGVGGSGGSSYIDGVILRDRDANTAWAEPTDEPQADGTLEERVYYCQNWRADVIALMTSAGKLINQVSCDPYGVPFGIAKTDLDGDGDVDGADSSLFATIHFNGTMPYADWNWDGTKDLSDSSAYSSDHSADSGLGRGVLAYGTWSSTGAANRKGYAGYEIDPVLTGSEGWESVYHVRNRVYLSQLGRWTRRDPLGYVDGMNAYGYGRGSPLQHVDSHGLSCSGQGDGCDSCCEDPTCVADCKQACYDDYQDVLDDIQAALDLCILASEVEYTICVGSCRDHCNDIRNKGCMLRCSACSTIRFGQQKVCKTAALAASMGAMLPYQTCKAGCRSLCQAVYRGSKCPPGLKCVAGACASGLDCYGAGGVQVQ